MGGGSADAAALLRFITNYYSYPLPSLQIVSKLGADIPVCIFSNASRVRGIGEVIDPINISRFDIWIVLVNPKVFVSTKKVFQELEKKIISRFNLSMDLETWMNS